MIGGWKENFLAALEVARGHIRELAIRHLRSGQDVIFPQLVTVYDQDPDAALQQTAHGAGATYVQVALMVDEQEHRQRLRHKRPRNEVEARIQAKLENPNSDLLDKIRGHLGEYLATRPDTILLDTTGVGEDASYRRLLNALNAT